MEPPATGPIATQATNGGPADDGTLAGSSSHEVIERALEAARRMLDMDMAFLSDTRRGLQDYRVLAGDAASFGARVDDPFPLPGTYCELLLNGRLKNVVRDARTDPLVRNLDVTERKRIGAYIGVPVVLPSGETYGTFCCLSHAADPGLHERDVRFMHVLARLIADQLERERLEAERRRLEVTAGTVRALAAALEARDGYTEAHSVAVVDFALDVGRELGLGEDELTDLENAALLHDVGKIGVPDAVLRKPGRLTEEEWVEMRRHPEIGARLVASVPGLEHLGPVIRAEHENFDGTGYPDGLAGDDIPLLARIVFVCDAYHAMTSDRPYRKALPPEAALAELRRNAGTQFCPSAVAAAEAVLARRG